ncbi:MAG: hypothetical protein QXT63_03995 [Thermoplasmata archaeon]
MPIAKRPVKATCPGCKKACKGEVRDRGEFILVICEFCGYILGVLPKYVQLCNWKLQDEPKAEKK